MHRLSSGNNTSELHRVNLHSTTDHSGLILLPTSSTSSASSSASVSTSRVVNESLISDLGPAEYLNHVEKRLQEASSMVHR